MFCEERKMRITEISTEEYKTTADKKTFLLVRCSVKRPNARPYQMTL